MAESKKQVVITDAEAVDTIEKYAEQKGISKAEAGARLVSTARGRINAVRKYGIEHPRVARTPKVKAPKAAKVKGAKAPKVAKVAKVAKELEAVTS